MKTSKLSITALLAAGLLMAGCSTWSNTGKGAAYGSGGGALLGAGIGALAGGGKGAAIGAAVGAGVGAGAGALIGKKMDKKQAELEQQIKDAQIEQVTDQNGLQAIKVTFSDGILFGFNSSTLSQASQDALAKFANTVITEPNMDISIYGNTDNVGTREANEKVSTQRAQAVENFLVGHGVPSKQIIVVKGLAYDNPVADNSTEAGRAQNRRVEIFLTANKDMVAQAEAGTLK